MKHHPLIVDLDGTLISTDLLVESAFILLKKNLLYLIRMFLWLISGKASMKANIAELVDIDVSILPYNRQVLDFIQKEHDTGRKIILATASHEKYAKQISQHLGLFEDVFATHGTTNLSAHRKCQKLVEKFGDKGFDYMGNAKDDLHVWKSAHHAYVVNPERGVLSRANRLGNVQDVINDKPSVMKVWIKQLRLYQWVKNLLIFVPLLSSHNIGNAGLLIDGLIAFVAFGLCASSVYLLNDLLDLEDDRHHQTKRNRPLASGAISVKAGIFAAPLLLSGSFAGAVILLPVEFVFALMAYYVITLAYSMCLKRKMLLDVITLAILYTMRIIAGTFAFGLEMTFWLLAFSIFIFLSLAFVKRYTELMDARMAGVDEKARGRGYYPSDLEMIASLGASSGYIAVMVLALYIQEQTTIILYTNPQVIWLACPLLLFWVGRIWLLTHRGQMHDDPIVFAIKDRASIITGLLFGLTFWLAT